MLKTKKWETYEEVARYLLNQFACKFGLGSVEGKQLIAGSSGTDWEIDAKGVKINIKCCIYKKHCTCLSLYMS